MAGVTGKMANDTRFAWVFDDASPRSGMPWDQEILRTDRFVALPSAGSLVPGWTLVIPRRPMINLAEADAGEREELEAIALKVSSELAHTGKSVFCFEHGSGWLGSATGCGVDQAHLHIVPLPFDLLTAAAGRQDGAIDWLPVHSAESPLAALPRDGEYVALWSSADRRPMIGKVRHPISQWVRRVIADKLGIGAEWDYRTYPQTSQVLETLRMLEPLRANPER